MMARLRHGERPLAWWAAGIVVGAAAVLLTTAVTALVNDPDRLEDNGEIVILSGRDDSLGGQRQQLVNQWNELHPDSRARIVELSALADAQRSEMLARAQSGRGDIDVYNLDVTWTAEFADAGYIQSLDESHIPEDGFLTGPLATCRYNGELWALPFNTDVGLLYYRSDLLDLPPQTWEDLEDDVAVARARSGNDVDGYAGQFADYEGLTVNALEAIGGAGGSVVDDGGDVVIEDHRVAVTEGLDRLRKIAPTGVPALDEDSSAQLFRSNKALFMRNWPVKFQSLKEDLEGAPAVTFDVAPLPSDSGVLGGQNLAIAADTTRPRAARALIEFLTSERSQQILFERGGLPATRKVVYSDPVVRERYEYVPTLERALEHAKPRPAQPHYARFSQVLRTAVDGYLRQGVPLPDDIQDQLVGALKGRLAPAADD
jgi:multiple sugar transport system substrate-binding protein